MERESGTGGIRMALLSAVLLWAACPPLKIWPLAWFALIPLMRAVTSAKQLRSAISRGYLFGVVFLGGVWYWTGLTIVGWTGSAIGWLALVVVTLVLALYYAVWAGAAWGVARKTHGTARVAALAGTWVLMEWARTLGSVAFPWAQLAYSQAPFLPLIQIADITGFYGVSFLVVFMNAAIALRGTDARAYRYVWAGATAVMFVCLYGIARLAQMDSSERRVKVALMQGNASVDGADQSGYAADMMRLTQAAAAQRPQIFLWGESAAPADAMESGLPFMRALVQAGGAPLLIGSRVIEHRDGSEFNSAVLISAQGLPVGHYDKRHLVAFGEFIPFRSAFPEWLSRDFQFFDKDCAFGTASPVLSFASPATGAVRMGDYICYESMFPQYARTAALEGANLLVTQSNDAWFRSGAAMEQHLQAVIFRSVENRRDTARSTNTGITALVDACGRVVERLPQNCPAFRIVSASLRDRLSLYTRFGDGFVCLCGILVVVATVFGRRASEKA